MNNEGPVFTEDELAYMDATGQPIARLNKCQTALALGFKPHNLAVLNRKGLLMPLGSLSPYCEHYYSAVDIMEKAKNKQWLAKATRVLQEQSAKDNAMKLARKNGNGNS